MPWSTVGEGDIATGERRKGIDYDMFALAIWIARGDPLTRAAHVKILARLEACDAER
jgi:hypothetical protein